jgi:transcriptional regulator GlxA family with amidase domain
MPKAPRFLPNTIRTIDLVAFPNVQLLDVAGPLQVFATANDLLTRAGKPPAYAPRVVSRAGGMVTASAQLGLATEALPPPDADRDTLLIAGGPGVHVAAKDPALLDWVRTSAPSASRVASVCTGAFLLAEAGLLDNRRATTHWFQCADLARRYPAIRVEPDPIYVRDGAIWTSAGVTAGIDLVLALLEEDLGRGFALSVARHLVVFLKRPGGQAQFSTALSLQTTEDRFGGLHHWIGNHLADDLSLPVLANQAGMSQRSFSRHYLTATGVTPGRAVEQLRVEAAKQLLSETRLPVKRIAQRCGFGSEETMRRGFLRQLAATPQDYRARFSG